VSAVLPSMPSRQNVFAGVNGSLIARGARLGPQPFNPNSWSQWISSSLSAAPGNALETLLSRVLLQPKVPWPISIVPSKSSRSRTLSVTAAPVFAMSQAFKEMLTA
jgi:hypothetical protein